MTRQGFSLIELMIVILLIGIIAAVGIPRFLRSPVSETETFIGRLNLLVSEGVAEAQKTATPKRIFFNLGAKRIEVQSAAGKAIGKPIAIPEGVSIEDLFINGKSQFLSGGGEKRTVYFLINPEGISQEVRMILIDAKIRSRSPQGGEFEFYLNPFTSVFRVRR